MRALGPAAAGAIAFALLCGCGSPRQANVADPPTLAMAQVKDVVVLDPAHATDGLSLDLTAEILDNLVRFKPGTFDVVPSLATRWRSSRDGKTWTFTLRRGVVFSDGTPLDAAAVKFNFDRWRLPNGPSRGDFDYSYYASEFGGFPGTIADVRAIGTDTVVFRLTQPSGPFLRNLAMPSFAIGAPTAIARDPRAFEQRPVGSGPYRVAEWEHDDHITLLANERYWGPKPYYRKVVIRVIPDPATSVLLMQTADVDMLTGIRPDDARELAAQKGVRIIEQPSNNVAYLALNLEKKPFGDVRVRRAVAYALDIPPIIRALYGPGTEVANDWLPDGMLGDDPKLRAYPHDPALARELLRQAGLPDGFATDLFYPTTPRPYMPEPQRLAETIQADLRAAGIRVTLVPLEFAVFLARVQNGEHDACLIGWSGDNGDPDNFEYPLLDRDSAVKPHAQNYSFWRDPHFHALMIAGQTTIDERKRTAIYREATKMVHDDAPEIPLVHTEVPVAIRSSIGGFVPSPDTEYHFELMRPTT